MALTTFEQAVETSVLTEGFLKRLKGLMLVLLKQDQGSRLAAKLANERDKWLEMGASPELLDKLLAAAKANDSDALRSLVGELEKQVITKALSGLKDLENRTYQAMHDLKGAKAELERRYKKGDHLRIVK